MNSIERFGDSLIEVFHLVGLFVIGGTIVWSAIHEYINIMSKSHAGLDDILLLFIYLELGAMTGIFFRTHRLPVIFLLFIAMTAVTRYLAIDLKELGVNDAPGKQVLRLAALARASALDGVVCSPQEASLLREEFGEGFILVTPGVRPKGASMDDQSRVLTPADAIRSGSDYLVMGRPITRAGDPAKELKRINLELQAVIRG